VSPSRILCSFVLSVVWAMFSIVCVAQLSSTGVVSGTVIAPDGNPVPGAVVTLSGIDGPSHKVSSAADGSFLVKELPSGSYTLKATSAGFAPHEQSSVIVAVGRTTHLSIQLTVASTLQTVNVSAAPVTFDTSCCIRLRVTLNRYIHAYMTSAEPKNARKRVRWAAIRSMISTKSIRPATPPSS
jgi:Carboxypeptidase regulatory-like domain